MKIKDNKGFVLAETLIVSVFIMIIFTFVFTNFIPLTSNYERSMKYEDIDTKYKAHYVRKMLLDYGKAEAFLVDNNEKSIMLNSATCDTYIASDTYCKALLDNLNIDKVFITHFRFTDFKDYVISNINNPSYYDRAFISYLEQADTYSDSSFDKVASKDYRVIVRTKDGKFANIEVIK